MSSINKALAALEAAKKDRQKQQMKKNTTPEMEKGIAPVANGEHHNQPAPSVSQFDSPNNQPNQDSIKRLMDNEPKSSDDKMMATPSLDAKVDNDANDGFDNRSFDPSFNPSVEKKQTPVGHFIETPAFTRVDLSIAGTPHRISCPTAEVDALNKTAEKLNQSLRLLRMNLKGKSPNNEELLVLHCFELYDRIAELEEDKKQLIAQENEASLLIDRVLKSAQAIL